MVSRVPLLRVLIVMLLFLPMKEGYFVRKKLLLLVILYILCLTFFWLEVEQDFIFVFNGYFVLAINKTNRFRNEYFCGAVPGYLTTRMIHGHHPPLRSQFKEPAFTEGNIFLATLGTATLNPRAYWITGFIDGEGSFSISAWKSQTKTGWKFKLIFTVAVHKKDKAILELIKSYFGGQGEIYKHGEDSLQYVAASKKDLKIIIDHFNNYPLITQKQADFELFKIAFGIMERK